MSVIRELDSCRLLRPFLGIPKDRLLSFLEAERQPFISDPSNIDPSFERSRLRRGDGSLRNSAAASDLFSRIRRFGSARIARERDSDKLIGRCVTLHPAGFALFDLACLTAAPPETAERLLSAIISTIGGALYPPRRDRIARFCVEFGSGAARGHTIGGCRFIRWRERILTIRELARASPPMRITPGSSTVWDRRFEVAMRPGGSGSFTVGCLGQAGVGELKRTAPHLRRGCLPPLIFPILPALWDTDGLAAVPDLQYRREGIGSLPQIVFRPVNPLTQAGFAVV